MLLATVHFGPITVVPHRDKANPFRRSSILFRPHDPPIRGFGGVAGYRPRVRSDYYERVYVHRPGLPPDKTNIGRAKPYRKMAWRPGAECLPAHAPREILLVHARGNRRQVAAVALFLIIRVGQGHHQFARRLKIADGNDKGGLRGFGVLVLHPSGTGNFFAQGRGHPL